MYFKSRATHLLSNSAFLSYDMHHNDLFSPPLSSFFARIPTSNKPSSNGKMKVCGRTFFYKVIST